jgi:excisionase family DNA binding protein
VIEPGGTVAKEPVERLAYSIPEAARALGISRTYAYELAQQGTLPTKRLGNRVVVPRGALERLLSVESGQSG